MSTEHRFEHALTLHQPWGQAILAGSKRVENRSWRLKLLPEGGRWIGVHFGARQDAQGYLAVASLAPHLHLTTQEPGIYGAMRIDACVPVEERLVDPWACGPWCWVIGDVLTLPEPILCPGRQGLWRVASRPGEVE